MRFRCKSICRYQIPFSFQLLQIAARENYEALPLTPRNWLREWCRQLSSPPGSLTCILLPTAVIRTYATCLLHLWLNPRLYHSQRFNHRFEVERDNDNGLPTTLLLLSIPLLSQHCHLCP